MSRIQVDVFNTRPLFSNFFRFAKHDDWGIDLSGQQKVKDYLTFKGKVFYHNHIDGIESYSDQTYMNRVVRSNYFDYMIGGSLITEYKPVRWNTMRLAFNYRGDSHKQRDDLYLPLENDIVKEAREFYRLFLGVDVSDGEMRKIVFR